jgi:hypothetical protein
MPSSSKAESMIVRSPLGYNTQKPEVSDQNSGFLADALGQSAENITHSVPKSILPMGWIFLMAKAFPLSTYVADVAIGRRIVILLSQIGHSHPTD